MDNPYTATLILFLGFGVFGPHIDWETLYKKTGFYIPGFYGLFTTNQVGKFLPIILL